MKANTVTIGEKEYFSPDGYPLFGFHYDEAEKKYSIANMETKTATPAFADEVIYSKVPLETWTAKYVVVRIGSLYYLADNNGNCFFENEKPFVICRNVFVIDSKCIIVDNMKKRSIDNSITKIDAEEYGGINYAFAYVGDKRYLINSFGEVFYDKNKPVEITNCDSINEGFIILNKVVDETGPYRKLIHYFILIKNDFSTIKLFRYSGYESKIAIERLFPYSSEAYKVIPEKNDNKYVCSVHLGEYVDRWTQYGKIAVVENDGTSYMYFPNGKVKIYEKHSTILHPALEGWYYRLGDTIIKLDFDGNEIDRQTISLFEAYKLDIAEEKK